MPRDATRPPPMRAPSLGDRAGAVRRVALRDQATRALEAIRLTELGARAGLVRQLTGLEKAAANRLHRELRGTPSPPGQAPFTDAWFLRNDRRMLHASLVWRLHGELARPGESAARALIDVYECYRLIVVETLLDITRAAYVPRLVAMGLWRERACQTCGSPYLAPVDVHETVCPGCRLYHRYRCRGCGRRLKARPSARRRSACEDCKRARERQDSRRHGA